MANTPQPPQNASGQVCPYCGGDLTELSADGRENHIDWCRIVIGVPDVKSQRSQIHG